MADLADEPNASTAKLSWPEWLARLNAYASEHDMDYAATGDRTLTADTGEDCWRMFFDDGYSPEDALDEDRSSD
jgi:hypothetical protein